MSVTRRRLIDIKPFNLRLEKFISGGVMIYMKTKYIQVLVLCLFICCLCFVNSSYAFSGEIKKIDWDYDLDPGHKLPFTLVGHSWINWMVFHFEKCNSSDPQDYRIFLKYTHLNGDIDKVTFDLTDEAPQETVHIQLRPGDVDVNYDSDADAFKGADNDFKRADFSWAIL